jgi:hypothetical protein
MWAGHCLLVFILISSFVYGQGGCNFASYASQGISGLQSYYNQSNGFWGPFQGFSGDMWWCSANSATAIADFITMVPGNQQLLDTLQNSFNHVQYFNLNENNNQGGIDYLKSNPTLAVSNGFTDNFYDDEGW